MDGYPQDGSDGAGGRRQGLCCRVADAGHLWRISGGNVLVRPPVANLDYLVLVASIGRRAPPPVQVQTPVEKRKLSRRTVVASVLILLMIPVTLVVCVGLFGRTHYYITALLVMLECMLPFFLIFEGRKPQARELVIIAVLCAIGIAGRAALFMLPQFKPVLALVIVSGVALGGVKG